MTTADPTEARGHRKTVMALLVVASLVGFVAIFSVWVSRQLLETQTWTDTSTELLQKDDIRQPIAGFIVDSVFTGEDVQQEIEKALPPKAKGLAGPAAGGLRELANKAADEALQRPKVEELWATANAQAHADFVKIIEGNGKHLHVQDGEVVLDLGSLVTQIAGQLGVDLSGKIPPGTGQIVILKSDQISLVQNVFKALRPLAIVLTLLSVALFGAAIFLAKGWRRETVRSVGFAFILTGLAVLVTRGFLGDYLTGALTSTESIKSAVASTYDVITTLLRESALSIMGYGVVIILGAWLAGPGGLARILRRELAPLLRGRSVAYPLLITLLLLVFWWNPTPGTARLLSSLLLVALAIGGMEALRHVAIADFPDETMDTASQRWHQLGARVWKRFADRG